MKRNVIFMLVITSVCLFSAKKDKEELKLPDIETQMEKADKISIPLEIEESEADNWYNVK